MTAPVPGAPSGRSPWRVVLLLGPVAALNYLDRQMLASMKFSVMADIPSIANDSNWGLMLGQFKWVYAFLGPVGGYVADRFSRRWTIAGSLFAWSLITWWTGHVRTFPELLLARSLMGTSEAFYIPAALALIADWHGERTRSRAVGLHQMAIYFGVIAGGFGGYVAEAPNLGWRSAFEVSGAFGMLYALPLVFLLGPPPLRGGPSGPTRPSALRAAGELFSNGAFLLLVLYFTLPALSAWIVRDWLPAILKDRFAIGQGPAGVTATLTWQGAAVVGAALGGWLSDLWSGRSRRGRIFASALGTGLLVPAILGVGLAGSLGSAAGFLVLFGLGWGVFDTNNMPILCRIVPPGLRATGYGIMNLVSISSGGLADWTLGALRDRHWPDGAIFGVYSGLALLSVLVGLLIRPRPEAEAS